MGASTGGTRPTGVFRRFMPYFRANNLEALQPVVVLLREIGTGYSVGPAQVALRWLIENPPVLPIPGAKNGKQAAENAGALSFHLTVDEIHALDRATSAWRAG